MNLLTNYILRKKNNQLTAITIRDNHEKHTYCNLDHNSKVGETGYFHGTDMYHTKHEDTIVGKQQCNWDSNREIGKRKTILNETNNWRSLNLEMSVQFYQKLVK